MCTLSGIAAYCNVEHCLLIAVLATMLVKLLSLYNIASKILIGDFMFVIKFISLFGFLVYEKCFHCIDVYPFSTAVHNFHDIDHLHKSMPTLQKMLGIFLTTVIASECLQMFFVCSFKIPAGQACVFFYQNISMSVSRSHYDEIVFLLFLFQLTEIKI
jgi:hypothetical protein